MTVYRIVPHTSVLNSNSRKFMRTLYELLSVGKKPEMWWVIRLAPDKIEFLVNVPSGFDSAFRTKFANHEQWCKSTLADGQIDYNTPYDTRMTLKYERHDMFSLDFDYSAQATPVRDILTVTDEMQAEESVDLYVRLQAVDRRKWQRISDYAWDVWERGGVPYRAGIDPVRYLRNIGHAAAYVANGVKSVIDDTMYATEKTFFHGDNIAKPDKSEVTFKNPDRESLLINGDLSPRTKKKRNLPVFATSIYYGIKATDAVRREMLSRSIAAAFGELNGDNRLTAVNIRSSKPFNEMRDLNPNMLSTDEIGKLIQLPTADVQNEYKDRLTANRRVEIDIPTAFNKGGILTATATDRGTTHEIYVPTNNPDFLFTPRIVTGSPRMGKDQHVINFIVESKCKHGIGAVVLDVVNERNGHRGMSDAIRDHLPASDVIDIDLGNSEWPVALNLESILASIPDKRIAADRVAEEITSFLLEDEADDKIQTADYLREAAKTTNGSILGIRRMFTDDEYRNYKINELDGMFDMDIWRDYNKMTDGLKAQRYAPVMRRIGQIMNSELLKPLFCQRPNPKFNLSEFMREGKVVLFRIPTGFLSERQVGLLTHWLTLNVYLSKVLSGGKGVGTFLVMNEPHQFLTDGLVKFTERMLSEGPKYRLAPIIVFHHFAQFRRYHGFVDMLFAASANWHIFRNTNHGVYERLMPYIRGTFNDPQQAFEATKRYQFIATWLNDEGAYDRPFVADALSLVGKRYASIDNSRLSRAHSQTYGRPIDQVLSELRRHRST